MIYLLSLILALLPAYLIRLKLFGLPTTFLELLIVVFLFGTVVSRLIGSKKLMNQLASIKRLGKINYAIGLFVLAGIISTIISPEKLPALGQLKAFIIEPVLVFYAAVLIIDSKEKLATVLRWLFLSAGLISLFGIIQYFTYIHLPLRFWGTGDEVERITSVFDYPNALALYLAPLIGFYFTLWLKRYDLGLKKWLPTGLIIMGLGLLLTFSRGAWFAVALVALVLLARKYGLKKVLPAVVIAGLILFFIPAINQRIRLGLADPSSSAHLDLIRLSWQKIMQNPILGNGLGGFAILNQGVSYPHNIFFNFWLEMGLLGLISFGAVCVFVFKQYKIHPNALTLASGVFITVVILHGLVDVPYFKNDLSVLFWFMVAAAHI
ncbi:MAG: O-antigen ligase family protein [Candidatus Doudnabacteria bacterium]